VNSDGHGAELYDLSVDPSESKNVAKDHPEETARLQSNLFQWRQSMP